MDSLEPVGRVAVDAMTSPPPPPAGRGADEGHESMEQLRLMLGKRIYKYNTVNPSDVFGIKLKENLQFEGSLTFTFKVGGAEVVKVVTMTSATVVTDLLPQLIERFCFNHLDNPNDIMFNPSDNYITMQTEAGERRLLNEEHPLQLALDVVEHTEANPVFCFHTTILERQVNEEPENKRSSKFVSYEEVSSRSDKMPKMQSELQPAASTISINSNSSGSSGTPKKMRAKMTSFLHLSPIMPRRGRNSSNAVPTALPAATSSTYPPPGTGNAATGQPVTQPVDTKRTKRGRSSVGYLLDSFHIYRSRTISSKDDAMTTTSGSTATTSTDLDMYRNMPSPKASTKKLQQSVLLPIYGPSTTVASGQVYKTVLVSKESTTAEVIRHGLERYVIKATTDQYVLMDTIGKDLPTNGSLSEDVNDVIFTRVCSRQLHREEIPVIIDQLWKPAEGYLRRFELVKRSDVRNLLAQGVETDGENPAFSPPLYPKRPASCMSHTEHHLDKMSDSSSTDLEVHVSKSEDEVLSTSRHSARNHVRARMAFTFADSGSPSPVFGGHENALRSRSHESSPIAGRMGRRGSTKSGLYQVPQGSPYLLNMIPSRVHSDHVLFQLGPSTTQLGIFQRESRSCSPLITEGTATVHLHSLAEMLPESVDHLVVCQIRCFPFCSIGRKKLYPTVLEVLPSAEGQTSISVSLNGHTLMPRESYIVEHADVLQIGTGCMLMYVDPTVTGDNLAHSSPRWVATPLKEPAKVEKKRRIKQGTPSTEFPRDDSGTISLSESHENVQWVSVEELEAKQGLRKGEGSDAAASMIIHQRKPSSDSNLGGEHSHSGQGTVPLIVYRLGRWVLDLSTVDAVAMLQNIAVKASPRSLSNKLALAHIFALGVERCQQLEDDDRDMQCAEYLGKAVGVLQSSVMDTCRVLSEWKPDPAILLSALDTLHPLIGCAVFWLSNTLALIGYLQGLPPTDIIVPEALLTALHQLVQYALQELLYPITKVMYAILPRMVEVAAVSDSTVDSKGYMNQAVDFLQLVLYAFEDHRVSSSITAQFFGTVFCFINGSLLNHIFSVGADMHVLSHFSGRRLKDSLDILEGWSCGVDLNEEMLQYTAPLTSAVGILSTSRKQLMEMKWSSLRAAYPALHPAQLHFILDHYVLPKGCRRPAGWLPPTEAVKEATDTSLLHENFGNHPPLDLSGNQPQIDLSEDPPHLGELVKLVTAAAAMQANQADSQGKRDSPYPDSGLDSPARSAELPNHQPSAEVPLIRVRSASMERTLESDSGEAPSVPEEMLVIEAVNIDEEQPPPVYVIAHSAPAEAGSDDTPSQVMPTLSQPWYTEVVVSRGLRDFGFQLKLSESPKGGKPLLVISSIVLGSISDEGDGLLQLSVGDNVVKIDGVDMCNDIFKAEEYLRHVEDEVTLTVTKISQTS